ncbi:hypothetical protein ACVXG7_27450 [Enterobacter hormaechei]
MRLHSHHLELLSPARDAAIAREAILHDADPVYVGGPASVPGITPATACATLPSWYRSLTVSGRRCS